MAEDSRPRGGVANYGRSWATEDEQVDTALILDDGGKLWERHSKNPKHATYLSITGEPAGRLSVQRVYKHVVKARIYHSDNQWSEIQDLHPEDVRFDGGASAGWHPLTWHEDAKDNSDAGEEVTAGDQGMATAATVTDQQKSSGTTRGQRVSYIRVSTAEQNLARQRETIGAMDREFQDKISARSRADRAGLEDCIGYLRKHDQLVVASIDRLARSLADLQGLIDQITDKSASVHFIKENLTFSAESSDPAPNSCWAFSALLRSSNAPLSASARPRVLPWRKSSASTKAANAPSARRRWRRPAGGPTLENPRSPSPKTLVSAGLLSTERCLE